MAAGLRTPAANLQNGHSIRDPLAVRILAVSSAIGLTIHNYKPA
jgi:hypothetical protein